MAEKHFAKIGIDIPNEIPIDQHCRWDSYYPPVCLTVLTRTGKVACKGQKWVLQVLQSLELALLLKYE